jgi:hypothetical protein
VDAFSNSISWRGWLKIFALCLVYEGKPWFETAPFWKPYSQKSKAGVIANTNGDAFLADSLKHHLYHHKSVVGQFQIMRAINTKLKSQTDPLPSAQLMMPGIMLHARLYY